MPSTACTVTVFRGWAGAGWSVTVAADEVGGGVLGGAADADGGVLGKSGWELDECVAAALPTPLVVVVQAASAA